MQFSCVYYAATPFMLINVQAFYALGHGFLRIKTEIIRLILLIIGLMIFAFGLECTISQLIFVNALIAVIMVFVTLREVSKIISYSTVEFFYDIYKSCIASIIMGIIVCYLNSRLIEINIENMLLRLAIAMGAGIFIYACLAFLLKIESILEIKSILKTRRK